MRQQSLVVGLASSLFLFACGDNGGGGPDSRPRPDARPPSDGPITADANVDAMPGTPDAAPDAMPGTPDAAIPDAPPDATPIPDAAIDAPPTPDAPAGVGDHLLITEVRTVGGDEFVEIYNPTAATVSLANYYLTDNQNYWQLPGHVAGNVTITVDTTDFLQQFPAGATIPAGGVIVVATDAPVFETTHTGVTADYTLQETSATSVPMLVTIPGGATPNPGLTNAGEMVALFFWNGTGDTVQDVDIVIAGNAPSAANTLVAKAPVDGPDGDAIPSPYLVDTLTIQDMESDTGSVVTELQTYKRIALEGLSEIAVGGNGITGHDETSEQSRTTWDSNATMTYSAATPKVVPAF